MKPESSFRFGKNYDSDYLSGKRLNRLSIRKRNQRSYRNKSFKSNLNINDKNELNFNDKNLNKFDEMEKWKNNLPNMKTKRLTLGINFGHKNVSNNDIRLANQKSSNVLNNHCIQRNDRQFKARINEDLLWILSKRNQSPKCGPNLRKYRPKHKLIKEKLNHKMDYSFDQINAQNDYEMSRNYDKTLNNSHQINESSIRSRNSHQINESSIRSRNSHQINESSIRSRNSHRINEFSIRSRNSVKNNKNNSKIFTQIKNRKEVNNKSIDNNNNNRKDNYVRHKPIVKQCLPSSLTIVQKLMDCYSNERKDLAKRIPEFNTDLVSNTCQQLRRLALSSNPRFNKNWIQRRIELRIKDKRISPPDKRINDNLLALEAANVEDMRSVSAVPSIRSIPYISSNNNELALNKSLFVRKPNQLQPKIGQMISKILKNVSEAIESISSKCLDSSFFD